MIKQPEMDLKPFDDKRNINIKNEIAPWGRCENRDEPKVLRWLRKPQVIL